jgi:tellurite resistance protein TerC
MASIGTPGLWAGFTALVIFLLALDLGVLHRTPRAMRMRDAVISSVLWVALAALFAVGMHWRFGPAPALEFVTGYLIEEALSVDNLFVFLVIFQFFKVPSIQQHRVLFWGIFGALVMRAVFIGLGAAIVSRFHWVFYILGAFLVYTGIKLLAQKETESHPEDSAAVRLFQRLVPTTPEMHGSRFFVRQNGRVLATPLLLVLFVVEVSDIMFAVDSVPAIFAVTTDPFVVYTSNVFAILGLRSLYFVLAGMMGRFHYLQVGLGLVLSFVGAKMLIEDVYEVPVQISLAVIVCLLAGSVVASLLVKPREVAQ